MNITNNDFTKKINNSAKLINIKSDSLFSEKVTKGNRDSKRLFESSFPIIIEIYGAIKPNPITSTKDRIKKMNIRNGIFFFSPLSIRERI